MTSALDDAGYFFFLFKKSSKPSDTGDAEPNCTSSGNSSGTVEPGFYLHSYSHCAMAMDQGAILH